VAHLNEWLPLLINFGVGPPGHGKTLAGQMMQDLVPGAGFHKEDCTKIHHIVDLWGASGPFQHSDVRPGLANHLRAYSGKPSIVVLDEFEKMREDAQNSLLNVFDNGEQGNCR
jgi:DNA polymerase III delta prime subunit